MLTSRLEISKFLRRICVLEKKFVPLYTNKRRSYRGITNMK